MLKAQYTTKIYSKNTKQWEHLPANFSTAEIRNIFNLEIPVIAKSELIYYKKALSRPVDLADVQQIENKI